MAVEMQSTPFIVPDLGPGTVADGGIIKSVSLFFAISCGGAVSSVYSHWLWRCSQFCL